MPRARRLTRGARDVLRSGRLVLELTRLAPAVLGLRGRGAARERAIARSLRRVFERMGPLYGKLGQAITSSPGLFPEALAEELRSCLDAMPQLPYETVAGTIRGELGRPMDELFESFEREPLAAASIAQVHGARLSSGDEVVVKVQRPGIEAVFRRDLRVLGWIAGALERFVAFARAGNPTAFIEDFAINVDHELDFEREARSMERFGANLAASGTNPRVRVPAVHWDLTGRRVLTMERVHGDSFDGVADRARGGEELADVLQRSTKAWMEAAFHHGFFHGDVHAGNLMLDRAGDVVFLDFGIMGTFDPEVLRLLRAALPPLVLESDARALGRAVYTFGGTDADAIAAASDDLAHRLRPILDLPLSEFSFAGIVLETVRVGARHGLRIPAEVILLTKVLLYIDRYTKVIAPEWRMLADPEMIWFLLPGGQPPGAVQHAGEVAVDVEPRDVEPRNGQPALDPG